MTDNPTTPADSPRWQVSASRSLAIASAIVGLMLPVSQCVRETFAERRELAVSRAEQEFEVRSAYLDRAVDPARPAALRLGVLRFLVQTSDDEKLKKWAQDEIALVEPEANQLKARLENLRGALDAREKRIEDVIMEMSSKPPRDRDPKAIAAAEAEINALHRSKMDLESKFAKTIAQLKGVDLVGKAEGAANATGDLDQNSELRSRQPGMR